MLGRTFLAAGIAAVVAFLSMPAGAQDASSIVSGQRTRGGLDWLVDANIGVLRVKSSDLQVAGDATVGVSADAWGIVAWGGGSAYQLNADNVERDTTKLEGAGEAWLSTGNEGDAVRVLFRATGGGANYSSTTIRRGPSDTLDDQTSWMGRGALLVGALLQPSDVFAAHVAAGGGVQFEWYDYTTAALATASVDDTQDLTFHGVGRFDAQWVAARDILSFRLRVVASFFKLSRDNEYIAISDVVQQQVSRTTYSQTELTSRVFADFDAASFHGFRPTVHGGLDHVRVSGNDDSLSTTMPVVGVGLLRPWM